MNPTRTDEESARTGRQLVKEHLFYLPKPPKKHNRILFREVGREKFYEALALFKCFHTSGDYSIP